MRLLFRARLLVTATIVAVVSASCAARTSPAPPTVTPDGVRFVLTQPGAQSIAVAGSFNGWSTAAHVLARSGATDVWSAVVPLAPGEYLFMYVVDGTQWVSPPLAEGYVDDGFGSRNGIVVVRPSR